MLLLLLLDRITKPNDSRFILGTEFINSVPAAATQKSLCKLNKKFFLDQN